MRSTDRGRTWASIAGDLPARSGAWSIAQDPGDAKLLFVGLEFGVYVTVDGGDHWVQLKGGIPTIQARDLAIHRREGDLVVGTFGRGAYILDDYTALREVTPEALAERARLFPAARRLSLQRAGTGRSRMGRCRDAQSTVRRLVHLQRRTAGSGRFEAGADDLGRVRQAGSSHGDPGDLGLHRVAWDLRGETPPASQGGRGGDQTGTFGGRGRAGDRQRRPGAIAPRSARSRETRSRRLATRSRSSSFR